MTSEKKDFYGKEVADAIKQACDELGVPQEQLEIEVIETGSTGIFGLIRKKARITAVIKKVKQATEPKVELDEKEPEEKKVAVEAGAKKRKPETSVVEDEAPPQLNDDAEEEESKGESGGCEESEKVEELPESALELVKNELTQLLDLMEYPSTVVVSAKGTSVLCQVAEGCEQVLIGQDGKTLDSIQYLLRKIVARKIPNRLRLTVDVGNYREKRLVELKEKALELAELVKTNGKTQVIPALSPSERRVIHMSLQDDKEIRSRSVGDGLFKKILIYKPGKNGGKGGGRRRGSSRGRKGYSSRKKSE